jgi:hypothetical protein
MKRGVFILLDLRLIPLLRDKEFGFVVVLDLTTKLA